MCIKGELWDDDSTRTEERDMRVLVTGAAGVLGRLVTSALQDESEYSLRLTDIAAFETPHEYVEADLARAEQVQGLCQGIEQVLHIAAIHPWKQYTAEQYLDCNVKGTHNLVQEAAGARVQRLIYTSSIAAMGYQVEPDTPFPFDEQKPCRPVEDIYSLSKYVGEQCCELLRFREGLDYVALRPGTFIPREEEDPVFGLGLLGTVVHATDVAAAHVLALQSDVVNEAIIITAGNPFSRDDGPALLSDARSVILKYYPEAEALEDEGIELPKRIAPCYRIEKARRLLAYEPQFTFERWLAGKLS